MTYDQKLRKIIAELDSDGADSEAEWAARMLASIGITPDNPDGGMNAGLPEAVKPTVMIPKPHPNIPMPCCERPETRTPNCFAPVESPAIGSPLKIPFINPIRASTKGW